MHQLKPLYNCELIKLWKLQWASHVQYMDDTRIPKSVFEGGIEEQKSVGKPRRCWTDSFDEDTASLLGFRNWRARLMDREGWKKDILKAKPRCGLLSLDEDHDLIEFN